MDAPDKYRQVLDETISMGYRRWDDCPATVRDELLAARMHRDREEQYDMWCWLTDHPRDEVLHQALAVAVTTQISPQSLASLHVLLRSAAERYYDWRIDEDLRARRDANRQATLWPYLPEISRPRIIPQLSLAEMRGQQICDDCE